MQTSLADMQMVLRLVSVAGCARVRRGSRPVARALTDQSATMTRHAISSRPWQKSRAAELARSDALYTATTANAAAATIDAAAYCGGDKRHPRRRSAKNVTLYHLPNSLYVHVYDIAATDECQLVPGVIGNRRLRSSNIFARRGKL